MRHRDPHLRGIDRSEASEIMRHPRYRILVLCVERSKILVFRTGERHILLVLDLDHSNYLSHTRDFYI